jgi:hypothetical protein
MYTLRLDGNQKFRPPVYNKNPLDLSLQSIYKLKTYLLQNYEKIVENKIAAMEVLTILTICLIAALIT